MTQTNLYDILQLDKMNEEPIDLHTVSLLTGSHITIDEVIDNLESYNIKYKHIYKSYGFDNFYDFYLFADSNTESLTKGGDKNLSKLNKVKRKVMRNGKMIDMTIYEDGNGEDSNSMDNNKSEEPNKSALRANTSDNGDLFTKPNPKKLASTLGALRAKGAYIPDSISTSNMFRDFSNIDGTPLGMMAVTIDDENRVVRLDGYISTEEATGVGIRSLVEIIKIGVENDMEVSVFKIESPEAQEFLNFFGFKETEDGYVLKLKNVREFVGEFSDFI